MTKRIVILILCALILPLVGSYVAAEIEDTQSSPRLALFVWLIFCIGAIALFYSAHLIAKRHYQFNAIGTLALIISLAFMSVSGWLANGAWYDYYFFSDYIKPKHTVQQHSQFPNQFLFKGKISDGAATRLIRKILNSKNVNFDKPIVLVLHSEGGSPQEAMIMAEFVTHYNIQIEVMGKCISACTRVLLASDYRYIHPRAWIGFHATYLLDDENNVTYDSPHLQFFNEQMELRLKQIGVNIFFIDNVKIQDSKGGFFPTYTRLKAEGIVNKYKKTYETEEEFPFYL